MIDSLYLKIGPALEISAGGTTAVSAIVLLAAIYLLRFR